MNPALAGLLSALSYGVGDFLAGLASRYDPPLRLAALTYPLSALALSALALALGQPLPPPSDLMWGALAGAVGLASILLFYRALSIGPMGPVSVLTGALSATVPLGAGLMRGEHLSVLGGFGALGVLAGTALLSAAPAEQKGGRGWILALISGVGFGVYFTLLGQAQAADGVLWTLTAARLSSLAIVLPLAAFSIGLRPRRMGFMLASAPGDTLGNLFYLLSVQRGGLALGSLLTSLYPAVTMLLAVAALRERLSRWQWAGALLALAGAAGVAQR